MQDIKQQVKHNKQDTDEQNVSLDHGIIPVENGTDAQGSESRPREYIFHDNGSGDQLRNAHTDGNDAGVHGVFQNMLYLVTK